MNYKRGEKLKQYLCVDIGGTSIKFGIYSEKGNLIRKIESKPSRNTETHNQIVETVLSVATEEKNNIDGVAISTAGIVDTINGKIIYSGYTIPNYVNTNWKEVIKKETGLDCAVENDVNAACLGEKWLGSLKDVSNAVCLTIGTGIGGSVMINNKIYSGINYTTGEIGYMIIGKDNFQNLASTSSLVARIEKRTGEILNGKEIFEKAKEGNTIYLEEINRMVEYLSRGLVNLIYMLNPEKIVLGGGVMEQQEFLEPLINQAIKEKIQDSFFLSTKIVFAQLKNDAGLVGALYNFLEQNQIKY